MGPGGRAAGSCRGVLLQKQLVVRPGHGPQCCHAASEAAFALSSLISQPEQWQDVPSAVSHSHANSHSHAKEEEEKPEDSIDAMDWDEPEEPLPAELAFLWQGVVQGE